MRKSSSICSLRTAATYSLTTVQCVEVTIVGTSLRATNSNAVKNRPNLPRDWIGIATGMASILENCIACPCVSVVLPVLASPFLFQHAKVIWNGKSFAAISSSDLRECNTSHSLIQLLNSVDSHNPNDHSAIAAATDLLCFLWLLVASKTVRPQFPNYLAT